MTEYYNFHTQLAEGWWGRRTFLNNWWRLGARDRRWVPPHWPTLNRLLQASPRDALPNGPAMHAHLTRLAPLPLHLEALPRRSHSPSGARGEASAGLGAGVVFEEPVAAGILLHDARRRGAAGYLALPQVANGAGALAQFLGALAEPLQQQGARRLIAPLGLSPHLPSGVLQNYFHVTPPLHTPYNPPYLPELVERLWQPIQHAHLFRVPLSAAPAASAFTKANRAAARIAPLDPARLAVDLLPLLGEATVNQLGFVPPDQAEANFLLAWLGAWPLHGWVAYADDADEEKPVGFVLLQGDFAPAMQRARGGRNAAGRAWLAWRSRRPTMGGQIVGGRLLYGAVARDWRGRGIGAQLLRHALASATARSWRHLDIGPLTEAKLHAPARALVAHFGGEPRQRYSLYETYV